jgi:hypothetical protein
MTVTGCQSFEKELKSWAKSQCLPEGELGWMEEREWLEEAHLMARSVLSRFQTNIKPFLLIFIRLVNIDFFELQNGN